MRALLLAASFLLAAPAWAEGPQADDDERPGERPSTPARAVEQAPTDSDTPTLGEEAQPPVTRSAKQLARDGKVVDKPHGGGTLKLSGRGHGDGTVNAEGDYAGVTIGGQGLPPHPPKLPVKGPQRMTWPGFQVRDGVPTVFLQTTGTPDYAVHTTPGAIHVTLRGAKIQLRNNRRPLKVAEFGTAITEVTAKPHGHDVVVTIKHKGEASHRERVEPSAGGYQLLVVELPGPAK
jgi:hypothetical protein